MHWIPVVSAFGPIQRTEVASELEFVLVLRVPVWTVQLVLPHYAAVQLVDLLSEFQQGPLVLVTVLLGIALAFM